MGTRIRGGAWERELEVELGNENWDGKTAEAQRRRDKKDQDDKCGIE